MPRRILIVRHNNESAEDQFKRAYEHFVDLAKSVNPDKAVILVGVAQVFGTFPNVDEILGPSKIDELLKSRSGVELKGGVTVSLKTWNRYDPLKWDLVLAIYPTDKDLDKIEENGWLKGVVVLQYDKNPEWTRDWRRCYDPEGEDQEKNDRFNINIHEEVIRVLSQLTSRSTDADYHSLHTHWCDEDAIKRSIKEIKKLIQREIYALPQSVEIWLRQNGCTSKDAKEIGAKIEKLYK